MSENQESIFGFDLASLGQKEKFCCICNAKNPEKTIIESSKQKFIGQPICSKCDELREYMKLNDVF